MFNVLSHHSKTLNRPSVVDILEQQQIDIHLQKEEVLNDYRIGWESRHASLLGRKEVFMGKAKFGIFGDGKELPQLAMARAFQKGDFRAGYYRDQTFMFAIGELTIQQYFAQLYADPNVEAEPASAGRMMNGHYATRLLDENGNWKDLANSYNVSADISPTAGQMPRLLGLAFASKLFRKNTNLQQFTSLSDQGNEIAFGTIGDASTSEGMFFEALNAAGVMQVPMLMSVWDDGYGISVPKKFQTTKSDISKVLAGLQRNEDGEGFEIFRVPAWDYEALYKTYQKAAELCRTEHVPVLIHVLECTQPQGHSTSGAHTRYKSKERLDWETEYDCLRQMRIWLLNSFDVSEEELDAIEKAAEKTAKEQRSAAWKAFMSNIKSELNTALDLLGQTASQLADNQEVVAIQTELKNAMNPARHEAVTAIKKTLRLLRFENEAIKAPLQNWLKNSDVDTYDKYNSHLYSESTHSALKVDEVKAVYSESSPSEDGRKVLQACFDANFERDPKILAFGEDVGFLGDVNQAFEGMQQKYGEWRVMDTGIRETTIIGQGIGAAMRGLRPIAEIQYLDYIYYAMSPLSDDLATLQYRTKGGQKAPLIVRTRGHRLEGIWHTGSPISALLGSLRGMYMLVPRNMTQAAGFYNTLLRSDDTALVIECLNGYRLKEQIPDNVGAFTVPLGVPEILREGSDMTIVTYGSMCRIVMDAAQELAKFGIHCEVIDVQSLLPFDIHHSIVESIKKTNRVIFADEDVTGGATGFMMQKVIDEQEAYRWLDSKPVCVSAKDNRSAYSSDGDYFTKPSIDTLFDTAYQLMHEANPKAFPALY